jgi:uncharacterized protein (TIGR02391 family)
MVADPLPDSLDGVQAELRLWAQERSKCYPNSAEWQLINARVEDLRHQASTFFNQQPKANKMQISKGSQGSVGSEMNKWYLEMRKLLREIHGKVLDARKAWSEEDKGLASTISGYLRKDYQRLQELWKERVDDEVPTYLGRHIGFGMQNDMEDILRRDLPELEEHLDGVLSEETEERGDVGFLHLLHPAVIASSYNQFQNGLFRDAVLNSVVAIFDLIRERTGIDMDGSDLVNRAFSLRDPYLILSELESESGQNDQKGFMQLFNGSYQGIRNPKAHSLNHDLTEVTASQYLVHASLLARRVSDAQVVKTDVKPSSNTSSSGR